MEVKQSYIKGINQDLSNLMDKSQYLYSLENGRVYSKQSHNAGEVQNFKGTSNLDITFPNGHDDIEIIGYAEIDNDLILFTTGSDDILGVSTPDCIWRVAIDYSGDIPTSTFLDYQNPPQVTTLPLAQLDLDFSNSNPIFDNTVTRYETSTIQHVYWTDNNNKLRHANIANDLTGVTDSTYFDMVSNVDFSIPEVSKIIVGGGSFECGQVQYAYYLFRENGNRTSFSPASPLFHIVSDSDISGDTRDYNGCVTGTEVTKAFEVTVEDVDTDFDYIRVYRVLYEDEYQVPAIGLAYEGAVTDTVIFVDTGVNLDTLTTVEYASLQADFTPKTIEVKDDRLFAGNLKEQIFDIGNFDSRSFRYNTAGICMLVDTDTSNNIYSATPTTDPNFSDTHDCINPYNVLENEMDQDIAVGISNEEKQYIFQSDGNTVGGTGINIDFKISYEDFLSDITTGSENLFVNSGYNPLGSFPQFANPGLSGTKRSYARDEIYRVGIRYINTKGQKSFPQWMCDIRMPKQVVVGATSWSEFNIYGADVDGYARQLKLQFLIKDLPDDAVAYEIMRVDRTEQDRTVLGMGMIGPPVAGTVTQTITNTDGFMYPPFPPSVNRTDATGTRNFTDQDFDVFEFISPEIAFDKVSYQGGDYLTTIGSYRGFSDYPDLVDYHYTAKWFSTTDNGIYRHAHNGNSDYSLFLIDEAQVMDYGSYFEQSGTTLFRNYSEVTAGSGAPYSTGYKRMIGILDSSVGDKWTAYAAGEIMLGLHKRNAVQYGGNTYEARTNNYYIPCDAYFSSTTSGVYQDVWGGDSWVQMFEHIRLFADDGTATASSSVNIFPVETTINLALRHDDQFHKDKRRIEEGEQDDFYKYNDTFSRVSDVLEVTAEPLILNEEEHYRTRVRWSNVKYNGEIIDNWTVFSTNNAKDLDTEQGSIQKIISFKNKLFAFQDTGIASLPVNEKAVTATTVGQTTLGTGGILETYDYITKESGTVHPSSIVTSNSGVFYFDSFAKEVKSLGSDQAVSTKLGISSILKNIPNTIWEQDNMFSDLTFGKGVCAGYDKYNQEILFSFSHTDCLTASSSSVSIDTTTQGNGVLRLYTDTLQGDTGFVRDIIVGDKLQLKKSSDLIECRVVTVTATGLKVELEAPISSLPTDVVDTGWELRFSVNNNNTLVYSEKLGAFESIDTFIPAMYLSNNKSFMSIPNRIYSTMQTYGLINPGVSTIDTNQVHTHRYGNRGEYYGVDNSMILSVVVSPYGDIMKSYNNLFFISDVLKEDGSLDSITPVSGATSARFSTNYQHSGAIDLTAELQRKFRMWRLHIPRSLENMFADGTISESLSRMRDSWIKIDLVCVPVDKQITIKNLTIGYLVGPN